MSTILFDTYTKSKQKKEIPNAVDMAKKLIADNPGLFKDCHDTYYKMAVLMHSYADKCYSMLNEDAAKILNELNNLTKVKNETF